MSTIGPFLLSGVLLGTGIFALLTKRTLVGVLLGLHLVLAAAVLVVLSTGMSRTLGFGPSEGVALLLVVIGVPQTLILLGVVLAPGRDRAHRDEQDQVSSAQEGDAALTGPAPGSGDEA